MSIKESFDRLIENMDNNNALKEIQQTVEIIEGCEEYYDNWGMNLSMSVLKNNTIVLSSKHWLRNCYIEIQPDTKDDKFVFCLWDILIKVSRDIKRELRRDEGETNFVFISNLNRDQTFNVYEKIIQEIENRDLNFVIVDSTELLGWNVTEENAVKIPWIAGFDWD
jgi:hypothetical protein